MLAGLHNIHSKRLVHFDVKPDNILLSERREALISDFGLAKQMNARGIAEQDRFYLRMIPPEGFQHHEHDVTFDVYQVGLTLYRMCNGNRSFYAQFDRFLCNGDFDRDAFQRAVQKGVFPNLKEFQPHIPPRLRRIIQKCLMRDPQHRFDSALGVSNALACVDGPALDWLFSPEDGKRVWRKNIDGTFCELTVESCGRSTCYKSVKGGQRRRVPQACSSKFSENEIQKFLGGGDGTRKERPGKIRKAIGSGSSLVQALKKDCYGGNNKG